MREPWHYIDPSYLYSFAGIAGFILLLTTILIITSFLRNIFNHRNELKVARIQSGNVDPMLTQTTIFILLRRGIILTYIGLIFFIGYLVQDVTVIIMCFPLALGLAYLTIFGLHYSGLLKMVPDDGTAEKTDTRESKNPIAESDDIR